MTKSYLQHFGPKAQVWSKEDVWVIIRILSNLINKIDELACTVYVLICTYLQT